MPIQQANEATYDLIIIGKGSAAAMYLNTMRTHYRTSPTPELCPTDILVIGRHDPWAGERGHEADQYTKNINQARQLFDHPTAESAETSEDPVDRLEWAGRNFAIILDITENILEAEVSRVWREPGGAAPQRFLVDTLNQGTFAAIKVVIATGAGIETTDRQYHNVPPEIARFRSTGYAQNDRIMDLDQFQRMTHDGTHRAVGIIGPNAGTDAIMQAATRQYDRRNVHWFIAGDSAPGVKLTWDVTSAGIQPSFTAEEARTCVVRYETMRISVGGRRAIKVTTNAGEYEVDYLVYAVGQYGGGINRAEVADDGAVTQTRFVDGELAGNLEPIYDVNQRFARSDGPSGGAWEHVVGLQLKGSDAHSGISIVGAAAVQAGRGVAHNYLDDEFAEIRARLGGVYRTAAEGTFRELFADDLLNFSNIFRRLVPQPGREEDSEIIREFTAKANNYIRTLERRQREGSLRVMGTDSVGTSRMATTVGDSIRLAKELCHIFILRLKAALFYGEARDRRGNLTVASTNSLHAGLRRSLPATVADGRLLGGMQRNVAGVNETHNVEHIRTRSGINFLEDQQTLALYIAVHFPNIPPARSNAFVRRIIAVRTDPRDEKLRGFSQAEIDEWNRLLTVADREERAGKPMTQVFNTFVLDGGGGLTLYPDA